MTIGWTAERFAEVAEAGGERVALVQGAVSMSFRALAAAARAQASELDLSPGDRVLIAAENSPAFAALVPAVWLRGAIPVIVHADAPETHLAHAIAVTDPVAFFADRAPAEGEPLGARPLRLVEGDGSGLPPPRSGGDDPASVLFTSGSTGLPKGVTQSAASLIDGSARMASLFGYRPDDRILCPIPFAFDYGWGQLLSLLLQGIPLVLPIPRSAFGLCDALAAHAPTVFAGVPAVFADLLAGLAPIGDTPRDSVRLITTTGSKVPGALFERLVEAFPRAAISLNYGLTETYRSASLPTALAREHPTSVGRAVPGVEIEIRREDGGLAAPGEEGEIVHRGAGTFLGYWNDPARTAEVLRPDPADPARRVVFTGDLGRIDPDGLIYVHGRRDRQIKSMGVRVSPDEVELLLLESGLLAEAAVSSVPNDVLGEMIVAFVVPAGPLPPAARREGDPRVKTLLKALKGHARKRLSAFMQPRLWIVMEALPRTRSAKVDYPALKAHLPIP